MLATDFLHDSVTGAPLVPGLIEPYLPYTTIVKNGS